MLHEDGETERNEGTKIQFFVSIFPYSLEHSHSECTLLPIAAYRQTHSACHVQHLIVQHIYCTNTVQTLQFATELYLQ